MAVRTNSEDVLAIMGAPEVDEDVVTSMITAASAVVDQVLGSTTLGTVLLTNIEKWLAAHMVASSLVRSTSNEKIGDAELTYTGKWGEMLKSTPYGQMVLTLDVSGEMARTGKIKASIYAVKSFDDNE
jgi:hypothetical protein